MLAMTKADLELQQKLTCQVDDWLEAYFAIIDQSVYGRHIKYDGYDSPFRMTARHVVIEYEGHEYSLPMHYLLLEPEAAAAEALKEYKARKAKQEEEKKNREILRLNEQIVAREQEIKALHERMDKIKR